jgi:hypothetical protein
MIKKLSSKIFHQNSVFERDASRHNAAGQTQRPAQTRNLFPVLCVHFDSPTLLHTPTVLCCTPQQSTSHHATFFTSRVSVLPTGNPNQKGERKSRGNFLSRKIFFLAPNNNSKSSASHRTPPPPCLPFCSSRFKDLFKTNIRFRVQTSSETASV